MTIKCHRLDNQMLYKEFCPFSKNTIKCHRTAMERVHSIMNWTLKYHKMIRTQNFLMLLVLLDAEDRVEDSLVEVLNLKFGRDFEP